MFSGDELKTNNLFSIHAFGQEIPISDTIVMTWIIMAVLIILSVVFTRNMKKIPVGKQSVTEIVVEGINGVIKSTMGHHWKSFAPYFGTVFLFLIVANMSSLFNLFPSAETLYFITGNEYFENCAQFSIVPPTKDINLALALAIISIVLIPISGIRYKGLGGWLKSFLKPMPMMLPFNILDYGTRILSLTLRLFGNILAGFVIMELLYQGALFVKPLIPIASAFFDLFDAGLQSYIFVFLSSMYIAEVIE
ncbi:MAG: F0F1-type synthase, alpha subunit [Oscillospiraceae bacterium]|nr:F0F1-type synthase, alpha subunit [Oscillospiraceae bacterium]